MVIAVAFIEVGNTLRRIGSARLFQFVSEKAQRREVSCDTLVRFADHIAVRLGAVCGNGPTLFPVELIRIETIRGGQDAAATVVDHLDNQSVTAFAVGAVVEPRCDGCFHFVVL